MAIRLRVLGESVIEIGEHRLGPEASALFGVLLYLALERGTHVARRTLIELFWPDAGEVNARHCLRQTLYKLRQLGVELTTTASDIQLDVAEVSADFLDLATGAPVDAEQLRLGTAPLAEVLPGYAPPFAPRFGDWLERRRDEVQAIVRRALSAALVDSRSRHRWADVEAIARQCLRLDPLNEEATLALAEATALTGSKTQALTMLDRYLTELGPGATDIRLPATVLRKRIAERLPDRRYATPSDAYFVGRDESVELLAGLLRDARAGAGRACLIWGEAGIGKTRLAAECAKAAALQGAQVLRVGCQASDARRPLSVFVDAVPGLLNLRGALGCSPTSMRYLRRLTEHDPSATTPSEAAQEADFLFANVRRAIFDLVDAIAGETTLLLVIEDVHWLDQTSWDVLREMIDWGASRRLLILFTSRTEHATGAAEAAPSLRLVRHRLGALDDRAAGALLEAMGRDGMRAFAGDVRDWCVRVAEGNPFFLQELAARWLESGRVDAVPQSLMRMLDERLSRLTATALRVLQICAVLGRHATFERLEAITGYKKYQLLDAVAELELVAVVKADGTCLNTRHELIADAALDRLGEASHRLINRNVARELTREIEDSNSATLLWECAKYWRAANDTRHIARLVRQCAGYLVELGLPHAAAAVFERALEEPLSLSDRQLMLQGLAHTLRLAGLWRQSAAAISRVLETRLQLDPLGSTHCDEELQLFEAEMRSRKSPQVVLAQVLACVDDTRADPSHRLSACSVALRLADHLGDAGGAERLYRLSRSIRGGESAASDALICGIVFHSSYGELAHATELALALVRRERTSGAPLSLIRALRFSRIPLLRSGNYADALGAVSEAFALAERLHLAGAALGAADDYADTAFESGNIDEARRWCATAASWAPSVEDEYLIATQRYTLARVMLMGGDTESARELFSRSLSDILAEEDIRRKCHELALWLRLNTHGSASQHMTTAFAELHMLHSFTRPLGGQDFTTWCIADMLIGRNEKCRAHSLVSEYTRHYRRETAPLPPYLTAVLQRLADN